MSWAFLSPGLFTDETQIGSGCKTVSSNLAFRSKLVLL
jgi:hypothetical protein